MIVGASLALPASAQTLGSMTPGRFWAYVATWERTAGGAQADLDGAPLRTRSLHFDRATCELRVTLVDGGAPTPHVVPLARMLRPEQDATVPTVVRVPVPGEAVLAIPMRNRRAAARLLEVLGRAADLCSLVDPG